ncbi:integrase catalytic domain-containing protein [Donghicola eburneus]|uniref:integrase catalytic domain-containing protein n=1 Tax=Donghicola eburneus TaxID=393278 RepID=UPI0008E87A9D|nr:Mu transposase C-terminal domain-containing protein [Donghicola eburneus]SFQ80075.1 Mu transposase, C-terminal [Donghicola eburneus]
MSRAPLYAIPKGSVLKWDGRTLRVAVCEEGSFAVECEDTGECFSLSLEKVEAAIRARDCDVISPRDAAKRKELLNYTGGFEEIEQLPKEKLPSVQAIAVLVLAICEIKSEGIKVTQRSMDKGGEHRQLVLQRAHKLAPQFGFLRSQRGGKLAEGFVVPQGRTLARYCKVFDQFDGNLVVLADRDHLKGSRAPRLVAWQQRFVKKVIDRCLRETKPSISNIYILEKALFVRTEKDKALCATWPSITTVRNHYNAKSVVAKALGRDGQEHSDNLYGAGSTDIRALIPGGYLETDQYLVSIFTRNDGRLVAKHIDPDTAPEELQENEVFRCWLHVIIDMATRMPLGWIIAQSADADHTMALLRMATRDKTKEKVRYNCRNDPAPPVRLGMVSADNGSATRNSQVYAAQLGMGVVVKANRTYHANDKPHIERLFGTIQGKVLSILPGYTGSHPKHLPGYHPKGAAKVTHDQLYGMITRYLVDEYPYDEHHGTGMFGMTPKAKLEEAISRYGLLPPHPQRDRILYLGVKREVSTTSEGVRVFNIPFNSTQLQRYADGGSKRVTVHLDPDDLRQVLITAEGLDEVLEARLSMTVFKDLTLEEAVEVMEAATRDNPTRGALHKRELELSIEQRARDVHAFEDARDPSNYRTIEQLQRRADRTLRVEERPSSYLGPTVAPGAIMDRNSAVGVVSVKATAGNPPQNAPTEGASSGSEKAPSDIKNMTFGPVKDSKL